MTVRRLLGLAVALVVFGIATCTQHMPNGPLEVPLEPLEADPTPERTLEPAPREPALEVVLVDPFVLSAEEAVAGDAGEADAGPPDAGGGEDAGPVDAGATDAGAVTADAGTVLAGCLKIMPLGDSITLGSHGGYRNSLHSQLTALGCGVDLVGSMYDPQTAIADKDHEGHPGNNIHDLTPQVQGWLASAKPDVILPLIGTNDIAWFSNDTAAEIADRHAQLVDRILTARPGAWLIVGSIPPISPAVIPAKGVNRAVLAQQLNVEIASRVHARQLLGKQIRFADVAARLTLADLYDGVHPTLPASERITASWMQALTPLISCAPHPPCPP